MTKTHEQQARAPDRPTRREQVALLGRHLLRSVVGSNAHGTAGPGSDLDLRTIFLLPTSSLVGLEPPPPKASKGEHEGDENAWELGHFINLCCKGSPTVLEVLQVEPFFCTDEGRRLRELYPLMLGRNPIFNAFYGYARGECKTFLSPDSQRTFKSMGHYLRILYNGAELLRTGRMTVRIMDTPIGRTCLDAKHGKLKAEDVLRMGEDLIADLKAAERESRLPEFADRKPLEQFLLDIRRENW